MADDEAMILVFQRLARLEAVEKQCVKESLCDRGWAKTKHAGHPCFKSGLQILGKARLGDSVAASFAPEVKREGSE